MEHAELDFSNPLLLINDSSERKFQSLCKDAINEGYVLDSSSCGFVNSQDSDYTGVFHAILVRRWALSAKTKEVK